MMSKTELLQELQKNTRLRVGLWLIMAIVGFYSVLLLHEYSVRLDTQYQAQVAHLARLQDVTSQAGWIERAEQAKSTQTHLETKLWTAASKGLAQADFQAWISGHIVDAKIQEPKLAVEEARSLMKQNQIWLVTAKLEGIFEAEVLEHLFLSLAQYPKWVIVNTFEVRQSNRKPRFTLLMSVYFQAT